MKTSILENLQSVCKILNEEGVEYLAIGGAAVALHGHERWSTSSSGQEARVPDLDFWYNPTYDNYFRVLNALEKLGENVSGFRAEKTPDPRKSFFRLERPLYTLDLLPLVPGLPRFREVYAAKETTKLGDLDIPVIGYDHLIQNKQALGRPKDREDIRQLELIKQSQEQRRRRPRQRPQ